MRKQIDITVKMLNIESSVAGNAAVQPEGSFQPMIDDERENKGKESHLGLVVVSITALLLISAGAFVVSIQTDQGLYY